jgi:phosphohistidine phosphatase SixA
VQKILSFTVATVLITAGLAAAQTNPTIVSKVNQNTKDFTRLDVSCTSGMQLIGGGAEALGGASILNGGFPSSPTTWSAVGHQPGVGNLGLSSYGICAKVSNLKTVSKVNQNTKDFTRLTVTCPSGTQVLGGGAEALGGNSILNGSFPVGQDTWAAVGHQPGVGNLGLSVYAICGTVAGYQQVSQVNVNTKDFTRLTVACPAGKKIIGGGAEALGGASILNGGFPTDATHWAAVGHQPGVGNLGLSSYAICAN